jgi:hypothetical protein
LPVRDPYNSDTLRATMPSFSIPAGYMDLSLRFEIAEKASVFLSVLCG